RGFIGCIDDQQEIVTAAQRASEHHESVGRQPVHEIGVFSPLVLRTQFLLVIPNSPFRSHDSEQSRRCSFLFYGAGLCSLLRRSLVSLVRTLVVVEPLDGDALQRLRAELIPQLLNAVAVDCILEVTKGSGTMDGALKPLSDVIVFEGLSELI